MAQARPTGPAPMITTSCMEGLAWRRRRARLVRMGGPVGALGARHVDEVADGTVALVAGVLPPLVFRGELQRETRRPRPCVDRRIRGRDLIGDRVGADPRQPLDDAHAGAG